jgi:hypothetical protein
MDTVVKGLIEKIMSSYYESTCINKLFSAYISGAGAYYSVVFDKNSTGDIVIHKICIGIHTNNDNMLSTPVTVHVEKLSSSNMGFGAVCDVFSVKGYVNFQFENCMR